MKTPTSLIAGRYRQLHYALDWLPRFACVAVLGIVGCAGTKTSDLQISIPDRSTSHYGTVLVSVIPAPIVSALPSDEQIRILYASSALQVQLVEKLKSSGATIMVSPANAVPNHAHGTLLLRCYILRAIAGNQVLRLAVGFGVGQSVLRTHTELIETGDVTPVKLASWDTNSTTGALPGPVMGFVGSVVAGQALGIVGGSSGLLLGLWQTQAREVDQSSTEIAAQLHKLFQQRDWAPSTSAD